jgi:fimbrial isopeptide formation D2 family protein/LPXTG-motif cell wall-anchored protein
VSASAPLTAPTGYYFLKDADAIGKDDEATLYILEVVGPTEIQRKAGTTTSDKTTDDHNDSEDTAALNATGQSSSDYDIGDAVPYQVKATLSDNVVLYEDFYKVRFVDTLESGCFDAISALTIKVNGNAIADTDDYTVTISGNVKDEEHGIAGPTKDGFDVTIVFTPKTGKDLHTLNGAVVTIDFTATLGTGAHIGNDGNSNTVKVVYSNNPNSDQEGETTPHTVKTFTFKVVINKVDGNDQPLAKAGFTLYKVLKADAIIAPTGADAVDAKTKNAYWASKAIATKTIAAADGKTQFSFDGLDDGYYVLCETETPAGYNTIDPQVFVIAAEHNKDGITSLEGTHLDGSTITFVADTGAGSLTAPIKNQSGTVLPSTGGIGTTIFYVLGGLLVVGAAVILVARRKAHD